MKKKSILGCILIVMISCTHNKSNENNSSDSHLKISGDTVFVPDNSPVLSRINLQTITNQEYNIQYKTTGTVKPLSDCMAEVSAPFEGRIVKSFVKLGQKVAAGSPLFELNSSDYFETVKMFLQSRQENTLTEMNYIRKKDLFEKGVSSKKELEEAESAHQIALKEYEKAAASLEIFNVKPDDVSMSKPLVVRAPISGEIVRNNIPVGQYLKIDAQPVLTVADLNKVWVVAHVKENKINMINNQDKVQVFIDAYPDRPVDGFVDYIGNIVDEQTRSVEVFIICKNPDKLLKPGMFATVCFVHKLAEAIVIPENALLQEEDRCYLYAQAGKNRFIKRQVTFTSNGDKNCIVNTGIVPGDVIVAEGGVYLR
jgi:membrane fusion protein, heavy metal efflux system